MSERGKRVVRVLLDRERDADVVERIERQGSITGYLRTLVRRDIHDERIDYAAMKAAELQAENAKLRELASGIGHLLFSLDVDYCAACPRDGINYPCPVYTVDGGECLYKTDMRELGVEVDG